MNILLIEDNKVMSKSLKYSLETNNYKVIALETIKASKEHLKTKPEIDLVILDINLRMERDMIYMNKQLRKYKFQQYF